MVLRVSYYVAYISRIGMATTKRIMFQTSGEVGHMLNFMSSSGSSFQSDDAVWVQFCRLQH